MADDKPEPREFPIEVQVGRVKVTVTLLLRPGTVVEQVNDPSRDAPLHSAEANSASQDGE